uniref:Uncharacterized protein n=1 Tax=Neogobius melanostomus TaxID=47308 RepID=A0A8C6SSN4_9GOBI
MKLLSWKCKIYVSSFAVLPANVPFRVSALSRSCVVIPCSYENPHLGIWAKRSGGVVYHNGRSHILDHFKDRTRMVGDLRDGDCSLEIDDIKPFDLFASRRKEESNVTKKYFYSTAEEEAGSVLTVSCSVRHTCPTHPPPEFVWSIAALSNKVTHAALTVGLWETTSSISFSVPVGDGPSSVTCTVNFCCIFLGGLKNTDYLRLRHCRILLDPRKKTDNLTVLMGVLL